MSKNEKHSAEKGVFLVIPLIIPFSVLMLAVGVSFLFKTVEPDRSRYGVVIGASDTKGRGANTTISILNNRGDLNEYQINSSFKTSEIRKIRSRVRTASKQKVEYITYDDGKELLSLRLMNGEVLVSGNHVLSAIKFTGWSMTISGIILLFGSGLVLATLPVGKEGQ